MSNEPQCCSKAKPAGQQNSEAVTNQLDRETATNEVRGQMGDRSAAPMSQRSGRVEVGETAGGRKFLPEGRGLAGEPF